MTVVSGLRRVSRLRAWYERLANPVDVTTPTRAALAADEASNASLLADMFSASATHAASLPGTCDQAGPVLPTAP
jgi:hypothetical protein